MTPEQIRLLKERILEDFNKNTFPIFLQDHIGLDFEDYVSNAGFRIQVSEFVAIMEEEGRLPELIVKIAEARPHDAQIQALSIQATRMLRISQLDPNERVVLRKRIVFINRKPLKSQLRFLMDSDSSWVLNIRGESKTGISYCWNFVRHLLEAHGCRRVIEIDLKNHVYQRYQSQISDLHLAETLTELMGLDISLPAHADQSTFKIQPFFNAFRSKMQANPEHFLLYFHQFDVALSEDAIHFIQFLARMVHSELRNVFLVLAGFEPGLPNELIPFVPEIVINSFNETDLVAFFSSLYDEFPDIFEKEPGESKDEFIAQAVEAIKEKVNLDSRPNVQAVGTAVQLLFNQITQQMLQ